MEGCKKELKEEKICTKKLEISLSQHHTEHDQRCEEIQELKGQAHQSREENDQLQQEAMHWERNSRHLQVFLDQKEVVLQNLLEGSSHIP